MNDKLIGLNPNPGKSGPIANPDSIKKRIPEILMESMGNVSIVCKKLGISHDTYYRWAKNNDEILTAQYYAGEAALDWVESKLFSRIAEGDVTSIIFYLKTKGRYRGYAQELKVSVKNPHGQSYNLNIEGEAPAVMHADDHDILERYVEQRILEIETKKNRNNDQDGDYKIVIEAKAPIEKNNK